MKLELMSMEELQRIVNNFKGNSLHGARVLCESAARELAKRENNLYHRAPMARALTVHDYL